MSILYDDNGLYSIDLVEEEVVDGIEWWMFPAEKMTMLYMLKALRPRVAIEIGMNFGGSLQVLSRYCDRVYSIEIDEEKIDKVRGRWSNVEFVNGASYDVLPGLINLIDSRDEELGFILVDGDHSKEAVQKDVECLLRIEPIVPLYILFHDSFNPGVREGITSSKWESNLHVRNVELDLVPGNFSVVDKDELWNGLALAVMLPEVRTGSVLIKSSSDQMFKALLAHHKGVK